MEQCSQSYEPPAKKPRQSSFVDESAHSNSNSSNRGCTCPSSGSFCISSDSSQVPQENLPTINSDNALIEMFEPQLITLEKLNYIVRVMNLTIENSELLASWLAENNLLDPETVVIH